MKRLDALLFVSLITCAPLARAATFTIVNDDNKNAALRQAIADANLTAEPDTIVLPAPADGDDPVRFDFGGAPESDDGAPVVLTAITSDITIEGAGADRVILSASGIDATMLVVRTDPTLPIDGGLELPARLTLRNLTIDRGRGGAAGAVVVRGAPPPTGERPRLVANGVVFVNNQGAEAGAIFNEGAPVSLTSCTFVDNAADAGVGAVSSLSGGSIGASTFSDNRGVVGAVLVGTVSYTNDLDELTPTTLSISGCTFTNNEGSEVGAVRSSADTGVGNSEFVDNRASGDAAVAGAVFARDLSVSGGLFDTNVSTGDGGAIGLFLDAVAPAVTANIVFSDFLGNLAHRSGGALFSVGTPVSITDTAISNNIAGAGGAGVLVAAAVLDVLRTRFTFNSARPLAAFAAPDITADERGDDVGGASVVLTSAGGALRLESGTTFDIAESCFVGNGATAVVWVSGATGSLAGNYWGSENGPADGDTLSVPAGTPAPTFVTTPPAICDPPPAAGTDLVPVVALIREDSSATLNTDFRVVRPDTDVTLMTTSPGALQVPQRSGVLAFEVRGVNDEDDEGDEQLVFRLLPCEGGLGSCPDYTTAGVSELTITITDNGNGEPPAEGEGEGECADELQLSARALVFEDHGSEPSTQELTVTNAGACALTLIAPLVRKGASQGFDVETVPQAELALEPGDSLKLTVSYARPDDSDDEVPEGVEEEDAAPSGLLVIESRGGARFEVPLTLAEGCGCRSTAGAPPTLALVLLMSIGLVARQRTKPRSRSAPSTVT